MSCATLETLSIVMPANVTLNLNVPNVKNFYLRSMQLPASFTSWVSLEAFEWLGRTAGLPFPNMSFAPNLHTFGLSFMSIPNTNVNELWTTLPTTIKSVTLANVGVQGTIVLPSSWTSLTRLSLRFSGPINIDLASIRQFHWLQELTVFGGDFPLEFFYSFPNLKKLVYELYTLSTIEPEFPHDFFVRMNHLTHLTLKGS